MRARITIFALVALLVFGSFGDRKTFTIEYKLAFSLNPYANSSPVTYGELCLWDGVIKKWTYLTPESFMRIATGEEYSKANPDSLNLFLEFEIYNSTVEVDTLYNEITYNFGTVDDIWKLRYSSYPFAGYPGDNNGWSSGGIHPSDGQQMLITTYGPKFYSDWIIADEAFRLLHDMEDPNWVSSYKAM